MTPVSITFQEDQFVYILKGTYHFQSYASLYCLVCDKPYVRLYTEKQKTISLQVSLFFMEKHLPAFFFRINRTTLININQPLKIMKKGTDHWLSLSNKREFKVSERKLPQLIDLLSGKITFI